MSYIIDKFNKGEAHNIDGAIGWIVGDEFRPLMSDAVAELLNAGLIDADTATRTNEARDAHTEKVFTAYREAMASRTPAEIAEERAEATRVHGAGCLVIDVITGERYTT